MRLSLLILSFFVWSEGFAQVSRNFQEVEKPKLELGGGVLGLNTPPYPGAKENRFRVIPFPWFMYRGEIFRLDEEGQRASFTSMMDYEVGVTSGFSFPISSSDISVRESMPDLDALIGLGPNLIFRFLTDHKKQRLNVNLGATTMFAVDEKLRLNHTGYTFDPAIIYWRKLGELESTTLFAGITFEIGSPGYNQYFYNVDPQFATGQRSSYKARGGLTQMTYNLGFAYQWSKKLQLFAGGSIRDLSLAKNRNSPLVERKYNAGAIVGFVWLFYESEEKAKVYKD